MGVIRLYLLQGSVVIPSCYPLRLVSRLPWPVDFFVLLRFILVMCGRAKLRVFFIWTLLISWDERVDMNNHGCRRRTENCPLTRSSSTVEAGFSLTGLATTGLLAMPFMGNTRLRVMPEVLAGFGPGWMSSLDVLGHSLVFTGL